jgi:peptidoglycan/LPS O-acetylase OafA/YrhL
MPPAGASPTASSRILDRLRRRTVAEKYIPGIDGLRFAAILSVVLLHISVQERAALLPHGEVPRPYPMAVLAYLIGNGARGVPIFFAISGFILALPFARHHLQQARPISLSFYFLRRLTRLEPPYLLTLVLRLPLLMLMEPNTVGFYARHFAASAFYLHNLIYAHASILNFPAWSLEIEIQFYCLVPLLAFYFAWPRPAARRLLLLVVMAGLGVLQVIYFAESVRATLSIVFWLQYFLAGFLIADLYLTDWARIPSHWLWEVVTLPLWFWLFFSWDRWEQAIMPFLLLLLFVSAFKGPLQRRFFGNAWISLVGGMCYSIYLVHSLALAGIAMLFARLHFIVPAPLVWTASLVGVLLIGTTLFVLVERPCMDPAWPKQLWRRWFPAAGATTDPAV